MVRRLSAVGFVYLFLFASAFVSCELLNPCGPFPDKYTARAIECELLKIAWADTSGAQFTIEELSGDTIAYNEFGLCIIPVSEYHYSQHNQSRFSGFLTAAYACSPVEPTTDELIDSLIITAESGFDQAHPQGSVLNALFDVLVYDNQNRWYWERFSLDTYLRLKPTIPQEIILILNKAPETSANRQFRIRFFKQGKTSDIYEFLTPNIVVTVQ